MTTCKVVIVEDEALVAEDLKYRLTELGYSVTGTAPSGEKALEKIDEEIPDLVLMDIQLKGEMDGIETAETIKNEYQIPVVYLTAYSDESFLNRAKVTEPFGYLLKPIETRNLQSTIEMALYKAKMEKDREKMIRDLEKALAEIKTLRGLIPICSQCKKIRDDTGYWNILEGYIETHSSAQFSHSMCPECSDQLYGDQDWYTRLKNGDSDS